jgi:transcriptional regulator with XRE-family HTH domain
MTPDEFSNALQELNWKQIDFCVMAGVSRSTPSRWMNEETPIPEWVPKFLGMAIEVKRLHATYVLPPKRSKKTEG